MFDFIESCLRHKSEIVIYEAAHAIVNLKNTSAKELASAVPVLQLFCSSAKPTLRFAAIRTLNKVIQCNLEIILLNRKTFCHCSNGLNQYQKFLPNLTTELWCIIHVIEKL